MTEENILDYLESLITKTDQTWVLNESSNTEEFQTSIDTLIVSINEENVYIEDTQNAELLYDGLIISLKDHTNLYQLIKDKESELEADQIINHIGSKIFKHLESKLVESLDKK